MNPKEENPEWCFDLRMNMKLNERIANENYRKLQNINGLIDFSSNDYLGLSRSEELKEIIDAELGKHPHTLLGATGSRLLNGNTVFAEQLENEIAKIHHAEDGLIFNSGYTANLSLFSCIPQKNDTIIYDEFIHASVIDGARLSLARRLKFKHNDPIDLDRKISRSSGRVFVAIESIYSMNGDLARLHTIAELCKKRDALLIVDEAHALGVIGTGLVDQLKIQNHVFARVITFGKALGLHGAIVVGSAVLKNYLINFARPFIYSTAMPFSNLVAIKMAYRHLLEHPGLSILLSHKYQLMATNLPTEGQLNYNPNPSPIQCVFIEGNNPVQQLSLALQKRGFDIRAIRSPTVPKGKERLRICVHTHNSDKEIIDLCEHLHQLIKKPYA